MYLKIWWELGSAADLPANLFQFHAHGCSVMRDRYLMPSAARNNKLGNRAPAGS
jgi:hypothetical protein